MYPGKPAVLWFKCRAWPIFKLTVALCAAFWAGMQYQKGWHLAVVGPSASAPAASAAPPADLVKPPGFSDLIPCDHPPGNGMPLVTNWIADAHNMLMVTNGSDANAIVKARDAKTGELTVSFFVAARNMATYGLLPYGTYRFQFVFGDALDSSCQKFISPRSPQRFPDEREFKVDYKTTERFTLTAVPKGNVQTTPISMTEFDAP